MSPRFLSAFFATLCGIASPALFAAPIGTGTVNLSGSVGVSASAVDFFGNPGSGCSTPGVGIDGCFAVNVPLAGAFSVGLTPLTVGGTIQDLVNPPTPISGPVFVSQFIAFNNGVFFDLTHIAPGGAGACDMSQVNNGNYSCTPVIGSAISPFTLTNSPDGTNASVFFNVKVDAYTGTPGTGTTPYGGGFTTQATGKNIAGILADINAGGTVNAAYSANFSGTDIPEPGTVALMGIGLGAILFSRMRRKSND